jgi:bacterioferritin-associated ferredoxin
MIVCVCNALKEREVRDAARKGARSPAGAYRSLGCQVKCGQCVPFARDVIGHERATA